VEGVSPPTDVAKVLFAPIAPTYDRYARLLSLGQDPRWRRFLVSRIEAGPGDTVLDVATGTGAVAIEIARRTEAHVVGLDQSPEMLAHARERIDRAGLGDRIELFEGRAEDLPFADGSFAALSFTYLLRYVADPAATMRELARVVRPGGVVASLEFGVPPRPLPRAAWELYVRLGLPAAGALVSEGWKEVGRFLGPSIRELYSGGGLERVLDCWLAAGIEELRYQRLSLGGGIVVWGRRR
jgi:demethylmenaquinone methyltransferase / 2-methoxy-6-polyprenyl-1,4-benzoquinol methylase